MKTVKARTQLGLATAILANVSEFEPSDVLTFVQDPDKLLRVVDCVNADRRQKVALVDFRADLADKLGINDENGKAISGALGLLQREAKKGKGADSMVWAETDADFIERVEKAVLAGTVTPTGFTLPTGSNEIREAAVDAWLQNIASSLGDVTDDKPVLDATGTPVYVLDINKTVRTSKGPAIPKWALDAADTIIKNGTQASWTAKFTSGYTSGTGIAIEPFPFQPFTTTAPDGSTPEVVQEVATTNRKNLAKAIAAARAQENDKRQAEFV